jgi:hypothetical protein
MPAQITNLSLQPPDLRLELPDLLGEGVDGVLLMVRVGRPVKSLLPEGFFEEPEESAWPLQVGLVDPPRHRIRQP